MPESRGGPAVVSPVHVVVEAGVDGYQRCSAANHGQIERLVNTESAVVGLFRLLRVQGGGRAEAARGEFRPEAAGTGAPGAGRNRGLHHSVSRIEHRRPVGGEGERGRQHLFESCLAQSLAKLPQHGGPNLAVPMDLRQVEKQRRARDRLQKQGSELPECIRAGVVRDRANTRNGILRNVFPDDRVVGEGGRVDVAPAFGQGAAVPAIQSDHAQGAADQPVRETMGVLVSDDVSIESRVTPQTGE